MPSTTTWNRLEPRARSGDMSPGLEARIHDPLWLLARQWQVGEFKGEHAGSPVSARLRAEVAPLTTIRAPGGPASDYDPALPLEAVIERDNAVSNRRTAAEAGLHFLRLLADEGMAHYREPFLTEFPLAPPAGEVDTASRRYLDVMAIRAPDGLELAEALRGGLPGIPTVTASDRPKVEAAIQRFLAWTDSLSLVAPDGSRGWQPERLEYRFEVGTHSGGAPVLLQIPEHGGGTLDWHSFVHDTAGDLAVPVNSEMICSTTLPARASYPGMPVARFWELEDSRVHFGGVAAAPTDLARMLVLDFAMIYGNDWYVLPLELPVGTLTHIRSLVVTDSFGARWSIGPASRGSEHGLSPAAWWSMYELSAVGPGAGAAGHRLNRLLLPPALVQSLESEPVEEVLLLRDEGANVAWAIERTVEGATGNRIDRTEAWHQQRRWNSDSAHSGAPSEIAALAYRLQAEIPEHWIPVVPEEIAPGRNVLRVSPLLRPVEGGAPEQIQPLGRLLEPGTDLLIPEEEVPAEGARVVRAWQYTRWTDGSTRLWGARRKYPGRGPGSSGLAFDLVEPWRSPSRPLAYEPVRLRVTHGPLDGDPVDLQRLQAGQRVVVHWEIRNLGTRTWRRTGDDALRLGTSDARDHPGRLACPSWFDSTRPAGPSESIIGPGQIATILFEIRAPSIAGPFEEAYEPLITVSEWIDGPGLFILGRVMA